MSCSFVVCPCRVHVLMVPVIGNAWDCDVLATLSQALAVMAGEKPVRTLVH
jgi:hypothetical protein